MPTAPSLSAACWRRSTESADLGADDHPVRVLIIDTDAALLRILERGLQAHGYDIIAAESAEHAAGVATDPLLRCVVLDWTQHGIDAKRVREHFAIARPDVPVIVLASHSGAAGEFEDELAKPFALEELIARIRARTRR